MGGFQPTARARLGFDDVFDDRFKGGSAASWPGRERSSPGGLNRLLTIDLPSARAANVRAPNDAAVSRIDGLYAVLRYIGIQNMADPSRISAFRIERGSVIAVRDMERGRADFRGPTTGAVAGDTLFYG
ncbi:MAG TPA: hypothetical protein VJ808_10830 [Gemmatimonadales bacterium]|nr:hypothetical protein [Gemmatimonadales bacterium]